MLGGSSTAAATLSTSNTSATPTSPTRPSRLRGLSYLRNYTHNHLHSHSTNRDEPQPLTRTRSSPGPPSRSPARRTPTAPTTAAPLQPSIREQPTPSPQRSVTAGTYTTGWVPTVGGQSGLSRSATQSGSSSARTSPAESTRLPTMPRDRAATVVDRASASAGGEESNAPEQSTTTNDTTNGASNATSEKKDVMPSIRFIPHQEPRATRPSLSFPIVNRTLATHSTIVKVGRYSERDTNAADALTNPLSSQPVGFKSKVVSRRHCEFWCANNQWYVKDVKSSSGTFLNHVRLSSPGQDSKPYPVNDGDIVQLGIDFKGGEEVIFRCVKIRIECNRGWQKGPNPFNTSTHKRLRNLASSGSKSKDSDAASVHSSECSICLNPVAPCQALFVAPCSHVWHYKCIRTLIYPNWPSFQCPNCRAYADLEADVEQPEVEESEDEDYQEAIAASEGDAPVGTPSTNRTGGVPNSAASEDELASMVNSASLNGDSETADAGVSSAVGSQPVPIAASTRAPVNGSLPLRSATPTNNTQFSLAAGISAMAEGQATPRNDAGPFLLDPASAGRRGREVDDIAREPVEEEEEEEEEEAFVEAEPQFA